MTSNIIRFLVLALVVPSLSMPSVTSAEERQSVVMFGNVDAHADPLNFEASRNSERKDEYLNLPVATRKKLESFMLGKLGTTGTGHIKLLGIYQYSDSAPRADGERIFHFIHADLGENRLQWSLLFDAKHNKLRILYKRGKDSDAGFDLPEIGG